MPTLVLAPKFSSDSQRLWRAADAAGWSIERAMGQTMRAKPVEPAIYGDALFAQKVASDLGHALIEPPADWLDTASAWCKRILHYGTLGEAFNLGGPTFVKPRAGERTADAFSFPSRVYENGRRLREVTKRCPENVSVLMSEPVEFEVEYRTFVLDGKVVTASVYMRNGRSAELHGAWACDPEELNDAILFAHEIAYKMGGWWYHPHVINNRPPAVERDGDIKVPPALVLDVGKIKSKGWALVSAHPAWDAKLYGCNELKVLDVLRRATVPLPAVGDDERWVPRAWS